MSPSDSSTRGVADRIGEILLDLVGNVPKSTEVEISDPGMRARRIAHVAARKAALTAGGLALPPGALGWLRAAPPGRPGAAGCPKAGAGTGLAVPGNGVPV